MQARNRRRIAARRNLLNQRSSRASLVAKLLLAAALSVLIVSGSVATAAIVYFPKDKLPKNPFASALQFENSQVLASNGAILYDMVDPQYGNRIIKPLELNPNDRHTCPQGRHTVSRRFDFHGVPYLTCSGDGIPPVLRDATIATEDPTFYSNPGFDPLSIVRAAYQDVISGHIVSGASTITQQLVKQDVIHDNSPTLSRKLKELVLAYQLTRRYPKNYILYYYLNSVYYGHLAYGVQAAAQTYFHYGVAKLKLWQAAMISGMPQAPNDYDPFNDPNPDGPWYSRMLEVLNYMLQRHYITHAQEVQAEEQAQAYTFHESRIQMMRQPDFVNYALDQFQQMIDPSSSQYDHYLVSRLHGKGLYGGLKIYTTIDLPLQRLAQQTVTDQVASVADLNVTDGALVSIDTRPGCYGCILAMVGTADYDRSTVSINMADSPRQPGSSFKVFNYVSAFEKGISPGSMVADSPLTVVDPSSPTGVYTPTNYDGTFLGPQSVRDALANSYNIPAVRVEVWNGVGTVAKTAHRFGITDLWRDNPNCCGYALTLGGLERGVKLVQETAGYGAFATNGIRVPPISFDRIVDRQTGKTLWTAASDPWLRSQAVRVAPAADTYLVTSILSDNTARQAEFGPDSPLLLDRPAAAKTGTTNSFTDNWTVGYTPQLVTGVWVGNANSSPMTGSTGITGAAPIWHDFMEGAFGILNLPVEGFSQPSNVFSGSRCQIPYRSKGTYGSFTNGPDLQVRGQVPYCNVPDIPSIDGVSNAYSPPPPAGYQYYYQPQQQQQTPPQTLTGPGTGSTSPSSGSGNSNSQPPSLLPGGTP